MTNGQYINAENNKVNYETICFKTKGQERKEGMSGV